MIYFIIEVIVVSVFASLFATLIKLIPKYPNWKYNLLQQTTNTGVLTILLTLLFSFKIYLSWEYLFLIILLILWLSVQSTNYIARKRKILEKGSEVESTPHK